MLNVKPTGGKPPFSLTSFRSTGHNFSPLFGLVSETWFEQRGIKMRGMIRAAKKFAAWQRT
jgi:hypothetical protein